MATVNRCLDFDITELADAVLQPKGKFGATPWFVEIDRSSYADSEGRVNGSKSFRTGDPYTYDTGL